jgi:hypothetical protein
MAKSFGCFCTQNGAVWTGNTGIKNGNPGAAADKHAEQLAFKLLTAANQSQHVYALVQNDFPCANCLDSFKQKSMGRPILFIIVENSSTYYKDWGFATEPPMPQVIYMKDGKMKIPGYVTTTTIVKQSTNPADPSAPWAKTATKVQNLVAINETPFAPGDDTDNEAGPTRPTWFPSHAQIGQLLLSKF